MQKLGFFELSQVAKIVGIPFWKAKNWANGRPLQIRPSVRGGQGRGYLNLYSLDDLHVMVLAKELYDAGFSSDLINSVVIKLEGTSLTQAEKPLMLIHSSPAQTSVEFVHQDWVQAKGSWLSAGAGDSKPLVVTFVRIQALAKRLQKRISVLQKGG